MLLEKAPLIAIVITILLIAVVWVIAWFASEKTNIFIGSGSIFSILTIASAAYVYQKVVIE